MHSKHCLGRRRIEDTCHSTFAEHAGLVEAVMVERSGLAVRFVRLDACLKTGSVLAEHVRRVEVVLAEQFGLAVRFVQPHVLEHFESVHSVSHR